MYDSIQMINDAKEQGEYNKKAAEAVNEKLQEFNQLKNKIGTELTFNINDYYEMPPKHPFIIPGVLPANRLALFSGAGGIGKSTIASYISYAITHPEPLDIIGDWSVSDEYLGSNVVFISYEDNANSIRRRMDGFIQNHGGIQAMKGKFAFINMHGQHPMFSRSASGRSESWTEMGKAVLSSIEEMTEKPSLVIIDPAAAAFAANENDRSSVRSFMGKLDRWCDSNSCAILLIAHPPKSGHTTSGSTDWINAARSMISVVKADESKLTHINEDIKKYSHVYQVQVEKLNDGKRSEPFLIHNVYREGSYIYETIKENNIYEPIKTPSNKYPPEARVLD